MDRKQWIIIISGIVIAIVIIILALFWIKSNYSTIDENKSSCNISDLTCEKEYDIETSSAATTSTYCTDLVKCKKVKVNSTGSTDYDTSGYDMTSILDEVYMLASIGCFNITIDNKDYQICCKGSIGICASLQLLLMYEGYNVYSGSAVVFNTTLCRALPSCFANNNSSPYILCPIPSFGPVLFAYTKDDNNSTDSSVYRYPECGIDAQSSGLPSLVTSAFGALGVVLLSNYQSVMYFIKLPKYDLLEYFSLTPYIFQSSRYGDNYSGDVIFASLTDSLNIQDVWNQLSSEQQSSWKTDGLDIIVLMSHNKDQVLDIYGFIQNILNNSNIPDAVKNSNVWKSVSDLPVFCLPLPAGSKYGNTRDPLNRKMLKRYRTNKYIKSSTKIYEPNTDSIGMLFRVVPKDEDDDAYATWKSDVSLQKNVLAFGIEKCNASYTAFKLSDQNGKFSNSGNNTYTWLSGGDRSNEGLKVVGSGFKKQSDYIDTVKSSNTSGNISNISDKIINDMKDYGYDYSREITDIQGFPSPYAAYNDYITSKTNNKKIQKWSQYGADLIQFNIALFGDCRDTIYPSSTPFCLGKYDVGVIVSQNYGNRGTDTNKILYNSLNIYDSQTSTSFGSFRGPSDSLVYSMAFSRQDLTCKNNLPESIDDFNFIPTGSHVNLAAAEDTTLYTLSRTYLVTNPTNGGFYTSPNPSSVPNYKLYIFSPCSDKTQNPYVCNDLITSPSPSPTSPSGSPTSVCQVNVDGDECSNDLRVSAQNSEDTSDSISSALCEAARNPKSTDKSTSLMYALVMIVIALCLVIGIILFSIYLKKSRTYTYALIPLAIAFMVIAILLFLQREKITSATANSYSNASDSR